MNPNKAVVIDTQLDYKTDDASTAIASEFQPVLSMRDLFTWVALSATLLGFVRLTMINDTNPHDDLMEYLVGQMVVPGIIGLIYLRRKLACDGLQHELSPGHWLLCLLGMATPFYLVQTYLSSLVINYPGEDRGSDLIFFVVGALGTEAIYTIGFAFFLSVRKTWWWLLVPWSLWYAARVLVTFYTLVDFDFYLYWQDNGGIYVLVLLTVFLVLFLGLTVYDAVASKSSRNWLHWFGIATFSVKLVALEIFAIEYLTYHWTYMFGE